MPEGPSLIILKERLDYLSGRKLTSAGGYAKMDKAWLKNEKLLEILTWGKHLLLRFRKGTIRVHLMLFGSVLINEEKKVNPSLKLVFGKEVVNFYVVQAKKIEESLDEVYDWKTDIMSSKWNMKYVRGLVNEHAGERIGDLLMNQKVFTGVGNIIRTEVMYRSEVHPLSKVESIPARVVTVLLKNCREYGKEFLKQGKAGTSSRHWKAYQQKTCERDGHTLTRKEMGKVKRITYYCTKCQVWYK